MEPLALSFLELIGRTSIPSRRNLDQQQTYVLERLENLMKMRIVPEVSEAWNERRIIRRRLQVYGSK